MPGSGPGRVQSVRICRVVLCTQCCQHSSETTVIWVGGVRYREKTTVFLVPAGRNQDGTRCDPDVTGRFQPRHILARRVNS